MNDLLRKIYEDVICNEESTVYINKRVDDGILDFISPYKDEFNEYQTEIVKTLMYQTVYIAEQAGFHLGAKFAIEMLIEILSDK